MKRSIAFAFALFACIPAAFAADSEPQAGQHPQTFEKQITIKLDYLLYLPPDYEKSADKKWPLIVFLHGSGERGSDVNEVKKHGPPKIVEKKDSPLGGRFIVVSPQCPSGQSWKVDELNMLLDDILAKYHVDSDRVYLTGLSMGGFGTWRWAAQDAKRFAAIAPMCGGGDVMAARRLRKMPVWVFHGEQDPTVPIERSREMVDALKKAGDEDVKFTAYPDAGHDCWTRSYDNPELYEWFLKHHRSTSSE